MTCGTGGHATCRSNGPGRGRREQDRPGGAQELVEVQRPVVQGRGQPEPVLDQHQLARPVAVVHPAELRDGDVRLVDDGQELAGKKSSSVAGRSPAGAAGRGAGSSSRCRCSSRPPAASPGRTRSACGGAAPRAACRSLSNHATRSSSSARMRAERALDLALRHHEVLGRARSARAAAPPATWPVSGSIRRMRSTSSPKNSTRSPSLL